jgi:hypothetical protein
MNTSHVAGRTHPASTRPVSPVALTPPATAAFGFVVYGLAIMTGEVFDINADANGSGFDPLEWGAEAGIALVAIVIGLWAGQRALANTARLSMTALALGVAAALSIVAFWAGWPTIFGAVAVGLGLEHRRRIGSLSATVGTAIALGSLAFVAGAVSCVLG